MNARTLRRAAERKAEKIARKAQHDSTNTNPISPAQQAANQANAQFSTGPRTETGKQTASRNALRTGLTGRTVLLPTDDLAAYDSLVAQLTEDLNPATHQERELVQAIVDTTWRLQRIVPLECAFYARGAAEFADLYPDLDPITRQHSIRLDTYLKYERSLRNLATQESRLQRRLAKDTAAFYQLQAQRQHQEYQAAKAAKAQAEAQAAQAQSTTTQPTKPQNGFEFSTFADDPCCAVRSADILMEEAA